MKNVLIKRAFSVLLSIILITASLPFTAFANVDISDKITPVKVYSFSSLDENAPATNKNYLNLSISSNVINVEYYSEIDAIEYRIGLTNVDSSNLTTLEYLTPQYNTSDGYNYFNKSYNLSGYDDGYYYLNIARARDSAQLDHSNYGDRGNCYRNALIQIKSGNASLIDFSDIVNNNKSYQNSAAYKSPNNYLDKTLMDVPQCLKDKNGVVAELTSSQLSYIKNVATTVTSGKSSSYDKAKAIYSYVSANTYYDVFHNQNQSLVNTVNNPYENIKKIQDGKNAYTCCDGYASMMAALLRSINIPTKLVHGYHLSVPQETWLTINAASVYEGDHYWVEFYDGTRWVTADANMGTSNKWNRNSVSDSGSFDGGNNGKKAQNSFTYFDPSPSQLATTHCILGIYSKSLVRDSNDVSRLAAFLNQKNSKGVTNATTLSSPAKSYSRPASINSWNLDLFYANYRTGKLEKLKLPESTTLTGALNLSGCTGLKYLTCSKNSKLTSLDLTNDLSLISVYASTCGLTKINATGCKALTTLSALSNPLTSAKYTFKSNKTASISATTGGTFSVSYADSKHTLKAATKDGYYFLGWYNSAGTKLSSNISYTTSTTSSFTVTAKFKALSAPTNVKISAASPTAQKISWSKVSGASGYYVYKSTSKTSGYSLSKVEGGDTTSVTKTGLSTGKTYYYYVVAYRNVAGLSYPVKGKASAIVSKKVVPPTPSVSLSTGKRYVTVKFSKISNVTGYEIYRATSSNGKYTKVKTVKQPSSKTISYKNTGLKKGKKYYYKVRSYKTVGSTKVYSSYSSVKSITCK
ncbi:MAG: transglutaminase domain-containing protein [Eubacterium sp.]